MKMKKKEINIFNLLRMSMNSLREDYAKKQSEKNFISLEKARENQIKN